MYSPAQAHSTQSAQLHIIFGPMFAGKTTRLLTLYQQITTQPKVIIGWAQDDRSNGHLKSHNPQLETIPLDLCVQELKDVLHESSYINACHVFIDEGQFFGDLSDIVQVMVHSHRKTVYLSGLYSDYQATPFANMTRALAHAQIIECLHSKCDMCGDIAVYSCLKDPLQDTSKQNKDAFVLVGGTNLYSPRCAIHRTFISQIKT